MKLSYSIHPLEGPRLKLKRAETELDNLRKAANTFMLGKKYEIVKAELNPHTGNCVYRVKSDNPPGFSDWGVSIGEIAHNLRSAP